MAENRIIGLYGEGNGAPPVPTKNLSVLAPTALVSIIVPCCGMLEYTKLCVPSVLRHSRSPYELIFLDIGSLDGTAEYLAGIRDATQVRVEIVRTQTDLGIPEACTEALAQARGEYVVLLNNDTVVTHAWLDQLIALASFSPAVGLAGPMSNYAAPPQLIEETVPYRIGPRKRGEGRGARGEGGGARGERGGARDEGGGARGEWLVDVSAVDGFAEEFRKKHLGKWLETDRLGGFCLLCKRAVLKKIESQESLAKISDLGLFDTDILSNKARQHGFNLAVCRDLFIHHFGTRTFAHGAPAAVKQRQGDKVTA